MLYINKIKYIFCYYPWVFVRQVCKFLLFFLFFSEDIFSQNDPIFKGGAQIGFTSAQIQGDGFSGFDKSGFMAGVTLQAKTAEKSFLQAELNYVTKGSFDPPNYTIGKNTFIKISLHYVEVPIMYNYNHKKWLFYGGVSLGILTHNKQDALGPILPPILTPIKKTETATILGIGYIFNENWKVSWRNSLSLLPICNTAVFNQRFLGIFGGAYNQYLSLQLQYSFK